MSLRIRNQDPVPDPYMTNADPQPVIRTSKTKFFFLFVSWVVTDIDLSVSKQINDDVYNGWTTDSIVDPAEFILDPT